MPLLRRQARVVKASQCYGKMGFPRNDVRGRYPDLNQKELCKTTERREDPEIAIAAPPTADRATESLSLPEPDLSIVLPAIDEKNNLELLLPALKEVIRRLRIECEILVIDGGSVDGTPETARTLGARVIRQIERGYGGALLAGFSNARAPFILTMDADLSHRPVIVEQMWAEREQADLLIASRYIPGGHAGVAGFRLFLSKILNLVYRRVLSLDIRDLSSGFRMYRRPVLEGMHLESRDFDVLEEILIRAQNAGWRLQEVPFHYMARGSGKSHVRLLKFAWAYLNTLVRMYRLRNSVDAADYDYRAFDSPIFLQRYWRRKRIEIISRFARGSQRVLDVGCGSGRTALKIPNCTGLDWQHNKLRWLRRRHPSLVQADGNLAPFSDNTFDCVICSLLIDQVPDNSNVIPEMLRLLKPGGTLILGTPDYARRLWLALEWIRRRIQSQGYKPRHVTRFTRDTLETQLREWNLEILACEYVGACEMIFKVSKPA